MEKMILKKKYKTNKQKKQVIDAVFLWHGQLTENITLSTKDISSMP